MIRLCLSVVYATYIYFIVDRYIHGKMYTLFLHVIREKEWPGVLPETGRGVVSMV